MTMQQHRKQNQKLNTQFVAAGTGNMTSSRGAGTTTTAGGGGGKDLIIRMLAEVFQVNNNTDGFQQQQHHHQHHQQQQGQRLARWEQVSSSLVPVSLYSRTTSRWLDYLLTASSVATSNTTSAMSPDSRNFLLLLQQFHQQNKQPTTCQNQFINPNSINRLNQTNLSHHQQQLLINEQIQQQQEFNNDSVIFQVVAHDFIDGQCKKVLNVKITQPGTRLGLASDYFVYWKEQQLIDNNMNIQSSFNSTSNSSFNRQQYSNNNRTTCCQQQMNDFNVKQNQFIQQTWGLNFASVNDAKLFYDICSLNLVDLDFNSDYLKLLASSDRNRSVCQTPINYLSPSSGQQQQQQQPYLMKKNKHNDNYINPLVSKHHYTNNKQHFCQLQQLSKENSINKQITKCSSCKQEIQQQRKRTSSKNESFNQGSEVCPIHSYQIDDTRQNSSNMRVRSRSSSRRTMTISNQQRAQEESLKRARSFSTPASPEHRDLNFTSNNCPIHNKQYQNKSSDQAIETHHPKCLSLINKKQQEFLNKQSASDSEKPAKPVRGVLRTDMSQVSQNINKDIEAINNNLQKSEFSSLLDHRRIPKAKYGNQIDMINNQVPTYNISNIEFQNDTDMQHNESKEEFDQTNSNIRIITSDKEVARVFNNSRANQRRSTGYDIDNMDHFNTHNRNARIARAQYANSKNMKEFLSLDAGGVQSTPTRIDALNEKFEQRPLLNYNKSTYADTIFQNNYIHNMRNQTSHKSQASNQQQNQMNTFQNNRDGSKTRSLVSDSKESTIMKGVANNLGGRFEMDQAKNVSTTTDDLPLDPVTRKRMYKLISGEQILDKKTPIKSALSKQIDYNTGQKSSDIIPKDHDERREPIVNPNVESEKSELRNRGSRSDIGRRRSLERSMCVDLDTTIPCIKSTTSVKKLPYCLSPLPQSTTPLQVESKTPPSTYCVDSNMFKQNSKFTKQYTPIGCEFATTPKRARTKSSGEGECCSKKNCLLRSCYDKIEGNNNCHHQFESHTSNDLCFKSSKSCNDLLGMKADYHNYGQSYDFENTTTPNPLMNRNLTDYRNNIERIQVPINYPQHSHYSNTYGPTISTNAKSTYYTHKLPGMSSYAVPLCSGEDKENFHHRYDVRQCQSCPNSLRRKRRELPQNDELFHHHHYTYHKLQNVEPSSQQEHIPNQTAAFPQWGQCCYKSCSCNNCLPSRATCQGNDLFSKNKIQQSGNCNLCINSNPYVEHKANNYLTRFSSSKECQKSSNIQQEGFSNICQIHGEQCVNCNGELDENKSHLDYLHRSNQIRPYSSQSSRSPIRFGLYESDTDYEETQQLKPTDRSYQRFDPLQQQVCCSSNEKYLSTKNITRSTSAYFGQENVKPVQGYDQTMARALLKNRQRAKSQPPAVDVDSSFHLTRSIENVQKLIKEVQNELNIMKCRPISGLDSLGNFIDSSNAAKIGFISNSDDRNVQQSADKLKEQTSNEEYKERYIQASNDENAHSSNLIYHQLSRDENEQNFGDRLEHPLLGGTSSATRKAAHFKCVGAIRKAGFLSVKKWILKRRQSIELARKQGWKRYWVCLRGTTLLFHSVIDKKEITNHKEEDGRIDLLSWIQLNCTTQMKENLLEAANNNINDNQKDKDFFPDNISQCYIEKEPRHLIIIDAAIAQPIPEHPKRDFVFCLSTTFGDAYLFQASCQLESDNWISAIHNACAASIARDFTHDEAIKLFESKIRHLEIESEKKIFLRQRLQSRLTSMSSMSHISMPSIKNDQPSDQFLSSYIDANLTKKVKGSKELSEQDTENKKLTMKYLLQRLNQQLLALDNYIEQIHCEIYQLRCYLSSCGAQNIFYQNIQQTSSNDNNITRLNIELPHPKSLLMHVSRATKLVLIKMGVFTVSSFHAYIHARRGSAESILQKIHQASIQHVYGGDITSRANSPIDLMIRSHSVSEALSELKNNELQNDTEELIHLSNIKTVTISVNRKLFYKIKKIQLNNDMEPEQLPANESDDRYSLHSSGDYIIINLKLHLNTNCLSTIKQVLKIIEPKSGSLDFLGYYLQFNTNSEASMKQEVNKNYQKEDNNLKNKNPLQYVAKRMDTLKDWNNFENLELMEKIIFKVELTRKRTDDESSPFGISIGAQLFADNYKTMLNVFCSYIEWASAADKALLKDDDEILAINGVPVMDLDMMFIECIMRDESKLKLVIRSSRANCPGGTIPLNETDLDSATDNDDNDHDDKNNDRQADKNAMGADNPKTLVGMNTLDGVPSQLITDEYISSLVCPPPPAPSSAFLRTDSNILRQKSDLSDKQSSDRYYAKQNSKTEPLVNDKNRTSLQNIERSKAKSQQNLNSLEITEEDQIDEKIETVQNSDKDLQNNINIEELNEGQNLASHLLKKTKQLTQLLGNNLIDPLTNVDLLVEQSNENCDNLNNKNPLSDTSKQTLSKQLNSTERLKRSIIELLETEYAYVKHLETINEHYMNPLEEVGFLEIRELRQLNNIIINLIEIQKDFFDKLTRSFLIYIKPDCCDKIDDEIEVINKIVQQFDSMTTQEFIPVLASLAKIFPEQGEKFRIYTGYCVTYSKLQKILHPRREQLSSNGWYANSITSLPNSLDTFHPTSVVNISSNTNTIGNGSHHREFLKPLGSFMTSNINNNNIDASSQVKQLNEFLSNLDSSSSSASISLPKTSSLSSNTAQTDSLQHSDNNQKLKSSLNSTNTCNQTTSQKSAHQQNFESYLIKPIQRIVKYPMLLNSIAISTQILDFGNVNVEAVIKDLHNAVKQMELTASFVNDNQKVHDEYGLIFEYIEKQYFEQQADSINRLNSPPPMIKPHQPMITLSIEQLLYFGTVDWLNIGEFTSKFKKCTNLTQILFVFNSCVVFICKEQIKSTKKKLTPISQSNLNLNGQSNTSSISNNKNFSRSHLENFINSSGIIRYQSLIPVSEVLVRSISATGKEENDNSKLKTDRGYKWELFRCSSVNSNSSLLTKQTNKRNSDGKVYYLLSSPTNENRSTFLRKIRYIIRESVQNMSLPLARSPSSKSLTPKKLSSPTSNNTINTNTTSSSCSQSTSFSPKYNINKNGKHQVPVNSKTHNKSENIEWNDVETKTKQFGNNQANNQQFTSSIKVNN